MYSAISDPPTYMPHRRLEFSGTTRNSLELSGTFQNNPEPSRILGKQEQLEMLHPAAVSPRSWELKLVGDPIQKLASK